MIVNGINLYEYTKCDFCRNKTHSYVSTWGDKPVSCMACKCSKEPGKGNVRRPWQDDNGNDTRPSGLFDLRESLRELLRLSATEQPDTVDILKSRLKELGESNEQG